MPEGQLVGKQVGNYVLTDLIGEGGMGAVYRAEHPQIGRKVAVKVLDVRLSDHPEICKRFLAEARAIARIEHVNIIDIYDFGRTLDGQLYYVMELLSGTELSTIMEQHGAMTPGQVKPYLEQVCDGLQAAHDNNVIHRDLKPENIFVLDATRFTLKLIDFGIARLDDPDFKGPRLTARGVVMGTPLTISPEQASGRYDRIGPQTDLYSLGVILYWMLSSRPPFTDPVPAVILAKHITEAPPPMDRHLDLPRPIAELVLDCLAKDPAERPASAAVVFERFSEAVEESAQPFAIPAERRVRKHTDPALARTLPLPGMESFNPIGEAEPEAVVTVAPPAPAAHEAQVPEQHHEQPDGQDDADDAEVPADLEPVQDEGGEMGDLLGAMTDGLATAADEDDEDLEHEDEAPSPVDHDGDAPAAWASEPAEDPPLEAEQDAAPELSESQLSESPVEFAPPDDMFEEPGASQAFQGDAVYAEEPPLEEPLEELGPGRRWRSRMSLVGGVLAAVVALAAVLIGIATLSSRPDPELAKSGRQAVPAIELDPLPPDDDTLRRQLGPAGAGLTASSTAGAEAAARGKAPALRLLAQLLVRWGKRDRALVLAREALRLDPGSPEGQRVVGEATADPSAAMEHYRLGLKAAPRDGYLLFRMGEAQQALGWPDRALTAYRQALQVDGALAAAVHHRMGQLHDLDKRSSAALREYLMAVEVDATYVPARVSLGFAYARMGRAEPALEQLDRAAALDPNNVMASYYRGAVLYNLRRPEEAIQAYRRALQLRPGYAEAHYYIGQIYADLGKKDEAQKAYHAALKANPDFQPAILALSRLH